MEAYSAFKQMDLLTHATKLWKHRAKWNKAGTKWQIVYDSANRKDLVIP